MKRSQRMVPVRKLKQQEERQKAQGFALAQQEWRRELDQLEMLQRYQQDYFKELLQSSGGSQVIKNAQQLDKYQMFLLRLDKAIENQRQMVVIKEKSVEVKRQEWADANARLKALDNLIEKMRLEEARIQDKQEQRMIDDLPLRNKRYE